MRNIILGMLAFIALFLGLRDAYAQCTCIKDYASAYDEFKDSDVVFIGSVAEIKRVRVFENTENYEVEIRFKVKKAWKIDLTNAVTIKQTVYGTIGFKKGESYLVYAKYHDNLLRANFGCCTRTKQLSKADADLKEFEDKGEKPKSIIKTSKDKIEAKPNN